MGNTAKSTTKAVATQEKRRQALELRKEGFTYEAIGLALEMSTSNAHKLVRTAIKAIPAEAVEDVRRLELSRLDKLMEGLWAVAKKGDAKAVSAVVRIMDRRAAYLGLDAPKQSEIWGGGAGKFDLDKALG